MSLNVLSYLHNFWADTRVKIGVSVISGMLLSWAPAIFSDAIWIHTTRADTTQVIRDFPVMKTLIDERFDSVNRRLDHLTVIIEKLDTRIPDAPVPAPSRRQSRR